MSFPNKKWINNGLLILFIILIFVIIPLPLNEEQVKYIHIKNNQWKFVTLQEGRYWDEKYPQYFDDRGVLKLHTPFDTEAYIETEIEIPKRGSYFALGANTFSNHATGKIILIDSKDVSHFLGEVPRQYQRNRMDGLNFDISPYSGQKVRIRIHQTSAPDGAGWGYYQFMRIHLKGYTLYDNLMIFLNMLMYIILFSLIVGFIIGFSGLPFFIQLTDRSHAWVTKNYNSFSKNDKWYIKYYLKMIFSIANKNLQYTDKINNIKLRMWIKITLMVGLPIMVIYITKVIISIMIIIAIAILILAVILWIIMDLLGGGSPSGGSVGGGTGSSSGSSSSPIFKTHKIEKSFFTDDKTLKDKSGKNVGTISKSFWDDDRQIIKDASGKQVGDIKTSFWDDDRQVIRDSSGEHTGDIRTSFWTGERIIEDEEGEKHGTIRKNWAGETIIDDEK